MADEQTFFNKVTTLFGGLPHGDLLELTNRAALDGVGRLCRQRFGERSLVDVVTILFPHYSPAQVAEVSRRLGITSVRNSCWNSIMDVPGLWPVRISTPDREATLALRAHQGPAILAFWHFGPVKMLTIALRSIEVPALAISRAKPTLWTNAKDLRKMLIHFDESNPRQRATALRQTLKHLQGGGKVAVAIDGSLGRRDATVPFLGRQFAVSRGAAWLARLSGAPVIPCNMQWEPGDWGMAIRVFGPLPRPSVPPEDEEAFEQAILDSVASHFEAYGRQRPGQFTIDQLAELVNSPKADP